MLAHHLDELPQLVNVVLGHMDLFGPRPERPEFVRVLRSKIPNYERRMDVLPGITGLAQIALPPDTDLVSVRRKLRMDLEYIRCASLSLDSRTFACTLLRLGGVRERLAMQISRVSKTVGPVMAELYESPAPNDTLLPTTVNQLSDSTENAHECLEPTAAHRVNGNGDVNDNGEQTRRVNGANGGLPGEDNGKKLTLRGNASSELSAGSQVLNALTIDVEDYFQVTGFEKDIDRESWGNFEPRVVRNTQRLLEILDRHAVKATFFVLGWVADRFPEIVQEIHDRGHEIGSHSYWHRLIYELTPDQFRDDVRRSRDVIQDIVGQRVTMYRAPSFSITRQSTWALDILIEEGFTIDTSVYPVHHDRYGMPHARTRVHEIHREAGAIWEFPPSVLRMLGNNLPVAGGGYFRLYPLELTAYAIQRLNKAGDPFLFYVHPWELDPDQPRMSAGTRISRFRHYVNIGEVERRLELLLELFKFGRLSEAIADRMSEASVETVGGYSEEGQELQAGRPR